METIENVLSANEAFYDAFCTGDVEAMEAIWAHHRPVSCLHPGWTPLTGRTNVLRSWRGILESPDRPAIQCEEAVAELYGDTAVVLCYEVLNSAYLLATNIFVREGDAWRLAHHHSGGPVPPPADDPLTKH